MTQTSDAIDYRIATQNDETDILAVLEEVAAEIPVSLDTLESQEKLKTVIIQCRQIGKSWVAADADGNVIGFALVMPEFDEAGTISLLYLGVSPNSRRRGIFAALMKKLKANGVPITASVLHGNRCGMVDHLVKIGFTKVGSDAKETKLRWAPPG